MCNKIFLTIILILNFAAVKAQVIEKHGLLVNGGIGTISYKLDPSLKSKNNEIDFKSSYSVGYRFRLNPHSDPFFIDVDANLGMKLWKSSYIKSSLEPAFYEASSNYDSFSIAGTFNYKIYKGLSGGVGIEPIYFFYQDGESSKNKLDIPLVAKLAYDFGKFEIGVNYKHGLTNTIKTDYIKSGKFRDIQISLFIPF